MSLAVNRRAKKLFKQDHPGRFWDFIEIKSAGRDQSVTETERVRYLAKARAELLSEEQEAAGKATRR